MCEQQVRCNVHHWWHECGGGVGLSTKIEVAERLEEIKMAVQSVAPVGSDADSFQAEARWAVLVATSAPQGGEQGAFRWHQFAKVTAGVMAKASEMALGETASAWMAAAWLDGGGGELDEEGVENKELYKRALRRARRHMYKTVKTAQAEIAMAMRAALNEYLAVLRAKAARLKGSCGKDVGAIAGGDDWMAEYTADIDDATGEEVKVVTGLVMRATTSEGSAKRHESVTGRRDAAKAKAAKEKEEGENGGAKMGLEEEGGLGAALLERIRRGFARIEGRGESGGGRSGGGGLSEIEGADVDDDDEDAGGGGGGGLRASAAAEQLRMAVAVTEEEVDEEVGEEGGGQLRRCLRRMLAEEASDGRQRAEQMHELDSGGEGGDSSDDESDGQAGSDWSGASGRRNGGRGGSSDESSGSESDASGGRGRGSNGGRGGSRDESESDGSESSGGSGKKKRHQQAAGRKRQGVAAMARKTRAVAAAIDETTNSSSKD